jgi:hypothetical protein
MRIFTKTILGSCLLAAVGSPALADDPTPDDTGKTAAPTPKPALPPSQSDYDTQPPVASPDMTMPPGGFVEQAGVGGVIAYGRPGVLELGGSAGIMIAPDFRTVHFSPIIGWFIANNLELSLIPGVTNIKANDEQATVWSAFVEPSYHMPFNQTTFGFLGLGVGAAYEHRLGTGFAVAPRIGANVLVGRSGVLTPALSYEYTTHDVDSVDSGDMRNVTLLAVSSALRINVGYTAMW